MGFPRKALRGGRAWLAGAVIALGVGGAFTRASALGPNGAARGGLPAGMPAAVDPAARVHRVECFELRGAPDGPVLGTASLHRSDEAGATQLEWQIHFPKDEVDVWHVESFDDLGEQWVWREHAAGGGRSLVLRRHTDRLDVTEWGGRTPRRSTIARDCFFPLELLENLRAGALRSPTVSVFDPLASTVESLRLVSTPVDAAPAGSSEGPEAVASPPAPAASGDARATVRHELLRADGTLFASFTFLGGELVAFRWQRGGLIAVRVPEERVLRHTELVGFRRHAPDARR